MAPRPNESVATLRSKEQEVFNTKFQQPKTQDNYEYKVQLIWINVIVYIILHSITIYGLIALFLGYARPSTILFNVVYGILSVNGITAGTHRLWTHRTYKANLPLRIFLMIWQTAALQNDIYIWSRDHRVHHKFTDTDADPHNSKRGFFFCHVGWLLCKKHRDVIEKGKTIDMSDVLADPVVKFQRKFYIPLILLTTFALPTWIPMHYWGDTFKRSFISTVTRYVISLNGTWCINSVTHMFGTKPYDKSISSVQNVTMGIIGLGEGWHNYHHTFPWDYKAHEFGNLSINFSGAFITFMSKIGWATELKVVPDEVIRKRVLRTGDGTWKNIHTLNRDELIKHTPENYNNNVWGYGDNDLENTEVQILKRC